MTTETELCTQFHRPTKGKGRPPRDTICAACDASYANHYPTKPALPRLAFPSIPEMCKHFTKKNRSRGKPAPGAPCAVCGIANRAHYSDKHPKRGDPQPVKHPEAIRPEHIPLGPKQGSAFNVASGEGKVKGGALAKTGTDKPAIIGSKPAKIKPSKPAKVKPSIAPKPAEPEVKTTEPEPEVKATEPETPWPTVTDSKPSAARSILADDGDDDEPGDSALDALMKREKDEAIRKYMRQGKTREEAEAAYENEQDDW